MNRLQSTLGSILTLTAFLGGLQSAKADAVSDKLDADFNEMLGKNLPPNNTRSLFDHLTMKPKPDGSGYTYVIPQKFEDLIKELTGDNGGVPPVIVMIPDGRSLQRTISNYTSPRIVAAFDKAPDDKRDVKALLKDRLYLGFVEAAHQIEVISYNEDAGRFEYQVIGDYEQPGKDPHVSYAQRGFCLACHQNSSPIFSIAPWMETNGNPPVQATLLTELRRVGKLDSENKYRGIKVDINPLDAPYKFDGSVRQANYFLAYQRLWVEGCGKERSADTSQCRGLAFLMSLQKQLVSFSEVSAEYATLRKIWTERPGDHVLIQLLSEIPNRNPATGDTSLAQRTTNVTQAQASQALRDIASRQSHGNEGLANLIASSSIPAALDPLVPRNNYLLNYDGNERWKFNESESLGLLTQGIASTYFSPREQIMLREWLAVPHSFDLVKAAIQKMIADPAGPFGPENFSRPKIIGRLFAELNINLPSLCCQTPQGMAAVVVSTEDGPPVIGDRGDPMALFRGYCGRCHRFEAGKPSYLNFFPQVAQIMGADAKVPDEWLQFLNKGGLPCNRLNWENPTAGEPLMPPVKSVGSTYDYLSQARADREKMLENYKLMASKIIQSPEALTRMAGNIGGVNYAEGKTVAELKDMLQNEILDRNSRCILGSPH